MQNIHGKEIDLLRTTVKVPGKRLPRATPATAPGTSPRANGLSVERSNTQLGGGTGEAAAEVGSVGWLLWSPGRQAFWVWLLLSLGTGCWPASHFKVTSAKDMCPNAALAELIEVAANV